MEEQILDELPQNHTFTENDHEGSEKNNFFVESIQLVAHDDENGKQTLELCNKQDFMSLLQLKNFWKN
jgi:hypothetical protein